MGIPILRGAPFDPQSDEAIRCDPELVARWLVAFLQDECISRRGIRRAVIGVSGGVDSAVSVALCAKAFGSENVHGFRLPYRSSSPESLAHGQLVIDAFGIQGQTIDISAMADGYAALEPGISPLRLGNVCARCRMIVLFDQSAKLGALPIGTGNKTERLFGYYTWHADDAPPINPLGDLLKSQIWQLAEYLQVPAVVRSKPPTADLVHGQTDEGDFGISYREADRILHFLLQGFEAGKLKEMGFDSAKVDLVYRRVQSTHWKRRLPTVAMISPTAIGESYLRPVDY